MKTLRRIPESLFICLALVTVPLLPRPVVLFMSRLLGDIAFLTCTKLRKIANANLRVAFGQERPEKELALIAKSSFRTFALLLLDIFWFTAFTKRRIRKYVHFDKSMHFYFEALPGIIVTGHIGNWEVLGLAFALHGDPCVGVAAQMDNPFVDRILNRTRCITGQTVARKDGAIRTILKTLKDGKRAGLLLDQNVLPSSGGTFVDFFGLPVPNSKVAQTLSERTGADIVIVYCLADDRGIYTAHA